MPGRLLAIAERLRDSQQRLRSAVTAGSNVVLPALEEQSGLLNELVVEITRRDGAFDGVHSLIADRVNNLLMSIQTASGLLRRSSDEATIAAIGRQLDTSVESGRESLRRVREALAQLR